MKENEWETIGDRLRVALRAVMASLWSETHLDAPGKYDRAKMLEALVLLEQVCTSMELRANGYCIHVKE